MLFRARVLLISCCFLYLELLPVSELLKMLFFSILEVEEQELYLASTCLLYDRLLFYIFIYLQYRSKEALERIESSLELFMENNEDLSLGGPISILSMFRLECICARVVQEETFDKIENVLFANSLIGVTIQNSSKRERSDASHPLSMLKIKKSKNKK